MARCIYLVGTIHQSTTNYSAGDLFSILEQIKPDIIFEELPPELHEDPKTTEIPLKSDYEFQERGANYWYYQKYHVPIVPVDIPKRNESYDLVGDKELYMFWLKLLSDKRLTAEENNQVKHYFEVIDQQKTLSETGGSEDINSQKMDNLIFEKREFLQNFGKQLITKYSNSNKYRGFLEKKKKWMKEREEYMAKEIVRHMSEFTKGAFPVGVEHRPELKRLINLYESELETREYLKTK